MDTLHSFLLGSQVIRHHGKHPATVITVYPGNYVRCQYNHSGTTFAIGYAKLKLYTGDDDMSAKPTLYSYTTPEGDTGFGVRIGTNSKNEYIIEVKGTNEILVLHPSVLTEVLPYTFSVQHGTKVLHYIGSPDSVAPGDVLIWTTGNTPQLVVVLEVDTKEKSATQRFKGCKLQTIPIK